MCWQKKTLQYQARVRPCMPITIALQTGQWASSIPGQADQKVHELAAWIPYSEWLHAVEIAGDPGVSTTD